MQENRPHHIQWPLILMGTLCLIAGFLVYILVTFSSGAESMYAAVSSGSDSVDEGHTISGSMLSADDFADLRGELFDAEHTDIMAPMPMEGVERAGVSEERN